MGYRAGDIQQFTIGGREFDMAPDTDITMFLPGIMSETTPNGNGKPHTKGTRQMGGFDGASVSCDQNRQDMEYLQTKQNAGQPIPFTMTLISRVTYAGSLIIEGQIAFSSGNGTASFGARGEKWAQV